MDSKNCYLTKALKKLGYRDVVVISSGYTSIGDTHYQPIESNQEKHLGEYFNGEIVKRAFDNKQIIKLKLQKI